MRILKKITSCFLAGVLAFTMMCAFTVSAGAQDESQASKYAVTGKYDGDVFVIKLEGIGLDETKEELISFVNGENVVTRITINTSEGIYCIDYRQTINKDPVIYLWKSDDYSSDKNELQSNIYISACEDVNEDETAFEVVVKIKDRGDDGTAFIEALKNTKYLSAFILRGTLGDDGLVMCYESVPSELIVTPDFNFNKKSSGSSAKNISSLSVSKISDKSYTGKAIKPTVTVKDGAKTLKNGTDYTLSYKNNTKIGTATVTIKGKGNYTGTKIVNFKILPKKTTLKVKKSGSKATLSWNKVNGAEKYVVYCSTNGGSYKKISTVSSSKTSVTISKLDFTKNTYKFRIRSYAKVDGKTYYSPYSAAVKA